MFRRLPTEQRDLITVFYKYRLCECVNKKIKQNNINYGTDEYK